MQCKPSGSSGSMEVDAIVETFQISEGKYGIKYTNYIGDGDSKTSKGIIDKVHYGRAFTINKKKCGTRPKKDGYSALR